MNYWLLILTPTFLLIFAPDIQAHNLSTANGKVQDHQHVYRRQQYGKPLQRGHLTRVSGSSVILWGSRTNSTYGKLNGRRDGPIIGDKRPYSGVKPIGKKKYGTAVYDYGKPARNK